MTNHFSSSAVEKADFLIVGGGLAAATAAETLRTAGAEGSVVILSAECMPPYHRPPLSKSYLTGGKDEARLLVHPESFYRQHAIDLGLRPAPFLSIPHGKSYPLSTKISAMGGF
jgi:NAD(P)H-nitrite reductase large subunit